MNVNRKIKFRCWDKQRNIFVEPKVLCLLLAGDETVLAFNTKQGAYRIPDTGRENLGINRFVLQQFTGLLDKNGREIFEGDIIKYTQHLFNTNPDKFPTKTKQVQWESDLGRWNVYTTAAGKSDVEVIGNIFENPELAQ